MGIARELFENYLMSDYCSPKHGRRFLRALEKENMAFFVKWLQNMYTMQRIECPYTEEDFAFHHLQLTGDEEHPKIEIYAIRMPPPKEEYDCQWVFLCTTCNGRHPWYFLKVLHPSGCILHGHTFHSVDILIEAPEDGRELLEKVRKVYLTLIPLEAERTDGLEDFD